MPLLDAQINAQTAETVSYCLPFNNCKYRQRSRHCQEITLPVSLARRTALGASKKKLLAQITR